MYLSALKHLWILNESSVYSFTLPDIFFYFSLGLVMDIIFLYFGGICILTRCYRQKWRIWFVLQITQYVDQVWSLMMRWDVSNVKSTIIRMLLDQCNAWDVKTARTHQDRPEIHSVVSSQSPSWIHSHVRFISRELLREVSVHPIANKRYTTHPWTFQSIHKLTK